MNAEVADKHCNQHVHEVTVHVNSKPVRLTQEEATGRQIKEHAIDQGVEIEVSFDLLEELEHGRARVVADHEKVHVGDHSRFAAIAPEVNEVTVHVNNKPVRLPEKKATGREIKEFAIKDGVDIKLSFQLLEELGGGRTRVIADHEELRVDDCSRFAAIAPDDNS